MLSPLLQRATELHRAGRLHEAEQLYRQLLSQSPADPQLLYLLAVVSRQLGNFPVAAELLTRSLKLNPNSAAANYELGCTLIDQSKLNDAIIALQESLRLNPKSPEAHNRLGNALYAVGQFQQAITSYKEAVALNPKYAGACSNLGNAHAAAGELALAKSAYEKALSLAPGNPLALCNLANVLCELGQLSPAIDNYRQALAARPEFTEAHYNLATAFARRRNFIAATESFTKAITLRPDYFQAHADLAGALTQLWKVDDAVAAAARAISLKTDFADAHYHLGNAHKAAARLDDAIKCYRTALHHQPYTPAKHSGLLLTLAYHPASTPQSLQSEARQWSAKYADPLRKFSAPPTNNRAPDRPLRIGYVSADFRSHVCAYFLWPLLSNHDRHKFKVVCYAQVIAPDAITEKFKAAADTWHSTVGLSDEQLASQIRHDKIDILIDTMSHTDENRLLTFARKPAPLQITWLGYIGTTGMSAIDYRLTDNYVDPPGHREDCFAEKPLRLPDSLWCYDPMLTEPPVKSLPAAKNNFITFGSLNHFFKFNEAVLTTWSQILQAVSQSRLIIPAPEGSPRAWASEIFSRSAIDPARIEFLGPQSRADYFQTYHRIDIALDPFPWNGHTTSLDAWWMGVPVISLIGQTAVSRAGLSFAANLNLPEFAVADTAAYTQTAARLAADVQRLTDLRATLRSRLQSSPLMDAPRFARNVESAYRQIWNQWCAT